MRAPTHGTCRHSCLTGIVGVGQIGRRVDRQIDGHNRCERERERENEIVVYVFLCICICTCIYIYICVFIYIYIYIRSVIGIGV